MREERKEGGREKRKKGKNKWNEGEVGPEGRGSTCE